jgi:hypothetical protein
MAERIVRDMLSRADLHETSIDHLLGALKAEWLAEYKAGRNDEHFHSFDRHAGDFDYCQVSGCQTTYVEYLGEL